MNSRERLQATLSHREPDRLCVDFGAGGQTGLSASAVSRLRRAVLGNEGWRVKVIEPYQMLGEVDEALRQALELDVVGIDPPTTMFGFRNEGWRPFELFDGTPVLVPEGFITTTADNGDLLMHPGGDPSAPPRGRMPRGGHFFDALIEQEPIDEGRLDPADNCEEFAPLSDADIAYFADAAQRLATETDCGIYLTIPGAGFGDIALVPAPWMPHPRGIRAIDEWYMSLLTRPDYVRAVFDRQCEVALGDIARLADAIGGNVDVAFLTGTDFGMQQGLMVSPAVYRDLFKPYHEAVNRLVHARTPWRTFIHSCGAVCDLIEEFIDAGFDVLNPVQCSAAGMEPRRLKAAFGQDIVFWGGGVDTQHTLPFGAPDEVYREVRERIDIFAPGGGYVFNAVHNVLANTPTENLLALFRALRDARQSATS